MTWPFPPPTGPVPWTKKQIQEHIWEGHTEDFVTSDGPGHKRIVQRQAMCTREQAKYRYADAMLKARNQ